MNPSPDFLPLAALSAFFGIALVFRVAVQLRRHGSTGFALFRGGSTSEKLSDAAFFGLPSALFVIALAWALAPDALAAALLPGAPWTAARALGIALACGGVLLILAAQLQMGASWRVGIDRGARPGLVTRGLFAWSRNPIYVGLFAGLSAFVLLLPTWPTLAIALLAGAAIRAQVGREEEFLLGAYGADYAEYRARVPRFVGCPR
jgi:protein-S-isoprenylcysteine O-methyltransferase Ste14